MNNIHASIHKYAEASHEFLVTLDADTLFCPSTITNLVRHFSDPRVAAVSGNVKVGNPRKWIARVQSIEYVCGFNLDRRALELLNAVTVVPGAAGAWRKSVVLESGGHSLDTVAATQTGISPPFLRRATSTEANGINAKGVVVGSYVDSTGATHGFVLTGKKYKTLDVPGAAGYTAAWSVNNSGVIGVYGINSAGSYVSFTTSNNGKTYKSLAYSGAGTVGTVIHAVSNKGDIDGTYFDSNGLGKGILFHQGKFYPFQETNDCGVSPCSTRADGLNGSLQIVGRYSPSDGTSHGFIAHAK